MAKSKIESTVELSNIAPALRSDLKFSLQHHGGSTCYLIEDEKNTKFFRVGIPEYTFISLLDGTTTIREAIAYTAARLGKDALSEHDAAAICKWLIDTQLAYTGASLEHERLLETAQQAGRARMMQALNPLLIKLPLARPDRLLSQLSRLLGWWFGRAGLAAWWGLMAVTLYQLITHWPRVVADDSIIFVHGNWLRLLLTWCVLKIIHEVSHGIACKRFGGHVRESGLLWIVFAPVPYVDVTSAWRFPCKWQRIFVSAAGMYTELAAAAVATLVWLHTEPGVCHQQAYNILLTASLVTLVFNANPLMRFDGYYILSDLLEIPNLYALGQQYTRHLGRHWFLGLSSRLPQWSARRGLTIKVYGVLAFFWRILVCAGLLVAASTVLAGAGIVLAIVAAITGSPFLVAVRSLPAARRRWGTSEAVPLGRRLLDRCRSRAGHRRVAGTGWRAHAGRCQLPSAAHNSGSLQRLRPRNHDSVGVRRYAGGYAAGPGKRGTRQRAGGYAAGIAANQASRPQLS